MHIFFSNSTYGHIRKSDPDLVKMFTDIIKINKLKRDGSNRASCLDTPALVKRF